MTQSPNPDPVKSPPPATAKPIKVPNPPEDEGGKVPPETPKVGSRDAPGG